MTALDWHIIPPMLPGDEQPPPWTRFGAWAPGFFLEVLDGHGLGWVRWRVCATGAPGPAVAEGALRGALPWQAKRAAEAAWRRL